MWVLPENGFNLKFIDKKTNVEIKNYSGVNFKILPRDITTLNINIKADSVKTELLTFTTAKNVPEMKQYAITWNCAIHGFCEYIVNYPTFYQPWTCTQTVNVLTNPKISYTYNNVEYIQNKPYTINNKSITVKNFEFYFKKAKSNLTIDNFSTIVFDFYRVDIIDTNDKRITLWSNTPADLSNIDDDKFQNQKTDSDVKITDR
jgi:hypothetical protein